MTQLDLEIMKEIVAKLYVPPVAEAYGDRGTKALRFVLKNLHKLYRYLNPELIQNQLVIFCALEKIGNMIETTDPLIFTNPAHLAQEYDPSSRTEGISVIQIFDSEEMYFWKDILIDIKKLSENAIVYLFENKQEFFIIKRKKIEVLNPSGTHASVFAIPSFRNLKDALDDYYRRFVRTSQCTIFSEAWYGGKEDGRLFFKQGPESIMRKSLTQHLKASLRDPEVRPEQIVDESHPVDIKVTWGFSNDLAIIEIKWLGKSMDDNGQLKTEYTASRARDGAEQLADYLDKNRVQVATHETKGYLAIFDGRRRGLNEYSTSVNRDNGMYYKDKEIDFNPEYHKIRPDFEEPIRMFIEPVCGPY